MEKDFKAAPNWKEHKHNAVIDLNQVRSFRIHGEHDAELPMIEFDFISENGDVRYWRFKTQEEADHCYEQLVNSFASVVSSESDKDALIAAMGKEGSDE